MKNETQMYSYDSNSTQLKKTGCGCLFWVFGLILFFMIASLPIASLFGGFFYIKADNEQKAQCTVEIEAVVEENATVYIKKKSSKPKTRISYAPVYSYEYNGKPYSIKSNNSSKPPRYDVGEKVEIMINPDNPSQIYEPGVVNMIFPIILTAGGAVGIIVIITAIIIIFKKIKKAKLKMEE